MGQEESGKGFDRATEKPFSILFRFNFSSSEQLELWGG